MEADPALLRERRNPLHLGKIKNFTEDPAHWGFDRDHPYWR
jgi:hypothetical protein